MIHDGPAALVEAELLVAALLAVAALYVAAARRVGVPDVAAPRRVGVPEDRRCGGFTAWPAGRTVRWLSGVVAASAGAILVSVGGCTTCGCTSPGTCSSGCSPRCCS